MKEKILLLNEEYSIKEINELEEFERLGSEWNNVANNQAIYKPFICFEWFKNSINHFLGKHAILILLLYEQDNIRAIAPFVVKAERFKGVFSRRAELIGNVYSPIRTFLFKEMDSEIREKEAELFLKYFCKLNHNWDVIDLHSIPEEYDTFKIFRRAVEKNNLNFMEYFSSANWYSDSINHSSDYYFKNRSKNLRASIKKNYRNARNRGNLEFRMITEINDIEGYIEKYFEVYGKSWKVEEKVGKNYLIEWIKFTAEKGWLRLGLVLLNGVMIGAGFALVCDGFAYLAKTAYDEKYGEIGPGSIWLTEMIKYVIDVDKVKEIDLLRGDEEYKKLWVAKRRERKGLLIFNNNIKGNYLSVLNQHLLPAFNRNEHLRRIKEYVKGFWGHKIQ